MENFHPIGLIHRYREGLQAQQCAQRTVTDSEQWPLRFLRFHRMRHPHKMDSAEVNVFLSHPTLEQQASASTQNQAWAALQFLHRELPDRNLEPERVVRARTQTAADGAHHARGTGSDTETGWCQGCSLEAACG
ncbi:MAG: hypothetical protein ER33_09880 [Cyanobium sp. CACIAM 14]|nr:MAG: hypothetical protein ER33_09880 [Cyanobium sp. CACIAM 14]